MFNKNTPVNRTPESTKVVPTLDENQTQYEMLKAKNSRSTEEGAVLAAFDAVKAAEEDLQRPEEKTLTKEETLAEAKKRLVNAQEALEKTPSNTV